MSTDKRQVHIGVAGCGEMGAPMARNLIAAGYSVHVLDVVEPQKLGDLASIASTDGDEFASKSDVVLSVVRDRQETLDMCFEKQGVFRPGARPKALILCSTLAPTTVLEVRDRLPLDVDLLDAPMSGATYSARDGSLTFMVGCTAELLQKFRFIFDVLGTNTYHVGDLSSGMAVKVLNNYLAATSTVAVRRILSAAHQLDIDHSTLFEVMSKSSGSNWFSDNYDRIHWSNEGYDPTNTIGILRKDVAAALETFATLPDNHAHALDSVLLHALESLAPD
ncbi:MAG: NAD(P)-dependent oxidoreductase [Pseudomonadota bacterium]